jgi:hypothetical protein
MISIDMAIVPIIKIDLLNNSNRVFLLAVESKQTVMSKMDIVYTYKNWYPLI